MYLLSLVEFDPWPKSLPKPLLSLGMWLITSTQKPAFSFSVRGEEARPFSVSGEQS